LIGSYGHIEESQFGDGRLLRIGKRIINENENPSIESSGGMIV
jgi:hypothetical protein